MNHYLIAKKWISSAAYLKRKPEKVKKNLVTKLANKAENSESEDNNPNSEILLQLKQKYEHTHNKSGKFQILILLPKSWPCKIIEHEFKISNRMAGKVKAQVKENPITGILMSDKQLFTVIKKKSDTKAWYTTQYLYTYSKEILFHSLRVMWCLHCKTISTLLRVELHNTRRRKTSPTYVSIFMPQLIAKGYWWFGRDQNLKTNNNTLSTTFQLE